MKYESLRLFCNISKLSLKDSFLCCIFIASFKRDILEKHERLITFIKAKRKALKMNQKDFGEYLGVTRSVINNIERGHRGPTIDFLLVLADKTDCSLDALYQVESHKGEAANLFTRDPQTWSGEELEHLKNYVQKIEKQVRAQQVELQQTQADYQKAVTELQSIKKKLSNII